MNFRGTEKAVLWDTSDADPARWTVLDLTDFAAANAILNNFSRLSRAYSVGTNSSGNLTITGNGVDTNGYTRAFIMTVSPPIAPFAYPPEVTVFGSQMTGFEFSFMSLNNANLTNYLEYTTNLTPPATWIAITSAPSAGAMSSLSDPRPPDTQRFYRIRIQ
jgi:hypothetical protein